MLMENMEHNLIRRARWRRATTLMMDVTRFDDEGGEKQLQTTTTTTTTTMDAKDHTVVA